MDTQLLGNVSPPARKSVAHSSSHISFDRLAVTTHCSAASRPLVVDRGRAGDASSFQDEGRCSARVPRNQDRLVEVQAVEVEGDGGHAEGGKPDADNGPGCQEEVQAAAVVEGGEWEDQATKVTVGSHDVVDLLLLAELAAVVLGFRLSDFTNQQGGHQGTVNGVKRLPTKKLATPSIWRGTSGCCARN